MAAALVQPNVQNVASCITPAIEEKIITAGDQIVRNIAQKLMAVMQNGQAKIIQVVAQLKGELQLQIEGKIPTEVKAKEIFDRIVLKTTNAIASSEDPKVMSLQMFNKLALFCNQVDLLKMMAEAEAIGPANAIAKELQPQQNDPINNAGNLVDSATKENPKD